MLIILRSPSCSGKSTLTESLPNGTVISSDSLRELITGNKSTQRLNNIVFAELKRILRIRLELRCDLTVLDATNLKVRDCKKYIDMATKRGIPYLIYSIEPPTVEELLQRNIHRHINTGFFVPEEVIERHHKTYYEQFDNFVRTFGDRFIQAKLEDVGAEHMLQKAAELNNPLIFCNPEWVIGDVHACHEELKELVDKIKEVSPDGKIVTVGDWIDRGESLWKTFEILESNDIPSVLGNHEYRFLMEYWGEECRSFARQNTHKEFHNLKQGKQERIIKYMINSPTVMISDDAKVLISHSGANITSITSNMIMNILNFSSENDRTNVNGGSFGTQVHGHRSWDYTDIHQQLDEKREVINIDSACAFGDYLTSYNIKTGQVIQIKAKKAYAEKR